MEQTIYPNDLTDEEWQRLEPLLTRAPGSGRPRKYSLRQILHAIFYTTCLSGKRLMQSFGNVEAAARFCHAFEEVRYWFRPGSGWNRHDHWRQSADCLWSDSQRWLP